MSYSWPLAINPFTLMDRLKICSFFLNFNNRWTQGKKVKEFERQLADYVGSKYAVMVSSGSSANDLIAKYIKDSLIKKGEWPRRNQVIVNAVSWTSNVSVFVREGFEPVFIDANLEDFCLNYNHLSNYLFENKDKVACVFPTSVLGYAPDIGKLISLQNIFPQVKFAMDNCESSMTSARQYEDAPWGNLSAYFTSSTSFFIAHFLTGLGEGGAIFTNNDDEYEYFLLSRAHGLRRNLTPYLDNEIIQKKYTNKLVDPQFDFETLASNYRNSDIGAFVASLDFERKDKYHLHRAELYDLFNSKLDHNKYYLPPDGDNSDNVAFCLPIVINPKYKAKKQLIEKVKVKLDELNIERRGFISGNQLRQKPYQQYGDYKTFKVSEHLNNYAQYVGLHSEVTKKDVIKLCKELNGL